jgi:hypothetical protein
MFKSLHWQQKDGISHSQSPEDQRLECGVHSQDARQIIPLQSGDITK